jgi:hypothetical protein
MHGLYRTIVRNAVRIAWRYKFLWFFGLFASFAANGEEYDILVRNISTVEQMQANLEKIGRLRDSGQLAVGWSNITGYLGDNLFFSALIGLVVLALFFLVIWLITVSQASIIAAAARTERKEKVDFLDLVWNGHRYFWKIFLVNLYAKIILYGLLLLVGIPLTILFLNTGTAAYGITVSLVTFVVLVPLAMIFSFVTKYASAYIVIQGLSANKAFGEAWKLFFKNWLVSLEMALMLFLINFSVMIVTIAILGFAQLPFSQIGFLFFMFLILLAGSVLASFQFSAWTLLFFRLLEGKGFAKLTRVFAERGWLSSQPAQKRNI